MAHYFGFEDNEKVKKSIIMRLIEKILDFFN